MNVDVHGMCAMRIRWKFMVFLMMFIIVTFTYINIYGKEERPKVSKFKAKINGKPKSKLLVPMSKAQLEEEAIKINRKFIEQLSTVHNISNGYTVLEIPRTGKNNVEAGRMQGGAYGGLPPAIDMRHRDIPPPLNTKRNEEATMLLTEMMKAERYNRKTAVHKKYDIMDIEHLPRPPYLPNYKNPCWYERDHQSSLVYLRCLPYALIVGFQKSGTTELHNKLALHPQVVEPFIKEPFFWGLNDHKKTLEQYSNVFSKATFKILSNIRVNGSSWTHPLVTFEATPSTLFRIPSKSESAKRIGNVSEPYHHALKDIKKIIPQAKIIVSMRNPIDRVYSEFMRLNFNYTYEFHDLMEKGIQEFKKCLKKLSLRTCVYWPEQAYKKEAPVETIWSMSTVGFSIYHVSIQDLLDTFSKEQIFYFRLEDYAKSKIGMLQKLFRFLELDPLDNETKHKLWHDPNPNPNQYRLGAMQWKTKKMLDDFYAPYNKKLAQILNDFTMQWKNLN